MAKKPKAAKTAAKASTKDDDFLKQAIEPEVATLTPEIRRIQAMFQDRIQSDSAELLREDRDR